MSSNQAHEENAKYQIIIYGLPHGDGDNIDTEIQKALPLLNTITPVVDKDIDWVDRFPSATDDGTYPLIVTFVDRELPDQMWEVVKKDRKAYPWYQKSLARHIRRWNARQDREVERLNSNAPDNEPTVWATKLVGDIKILRKIANPNYIAPAMPEKTVAGYPTSGRGSGRGSGRRPHGMMVRPHQSQT